MFNSFSEASLITGLTTLVTLSLLNEPASVESLSSIDGTVGPVKSNLISSVVSDSLVPFIIALKIEPSKDDNCEGVSSHSLWYQIFA